MILDTTPTIVIPKPKGGRLLVVDITTTLSIEERAKKSGLHVFTLDKSKPRNTCGVIIALGPDPILEANEFKVGQGAYFNYNSGVRVIFEGCEFRSLEWNEVISTLDQKDLPADWITQVQSFLRGEVRSTDL